MSVDVEISHGNFKAIVNGDNALHTTTVPFPPLVLQKSEPFRQYLTADGTSSGSNDMAVDGSSTNQNFFIPSKENDDRYITSLNFIVAYGASGKPYLWGDQTALTNGSRLFYQSIRGDVDMHEAIKINQDLFRLEQSLINTNWEVRHVNALNDYGYFISLDMRTLGLPFGIKLDRGTSHRLSISIRDNLTAINDFNCIAYGMDRFE